MSTSTPTRSSTRKKRTTGSIIMGGLRNVPLLIPLVLVVVTLYVLIPAFRTGTNVENVLYAAAILVIPGLAMTLCITMGEFDLSVGATLAITGAVACAAIVAGFPTPIALILALIVGTLIGVGNGLIVTKIGVTPFIATLATMVILRGVTQAFTNGKDVHVSDALLKYFAAGRPLGIPFPIVLAIVAIVAFLWITYRTRFGRWVAAVGSNRDAAKLSGLPVDRIRIMVYTIIGLSGAVWGIIISGQLQKGSAVLGVGFELDAITIVVIGGTALIGGRASIIGTVLGALLVVTIQNGLNLLNVPPAYQQISVGILLVGALAIQAIRRKIPVEALDDKH